MLIVYFQDWDLIRQIMRSSRLVKFFLNIRGPPFEGKLFEECWCDPIVTALRSRILLLRRVSLSVEDT